MLLSLSLIRCSSSASLICAGRCVISFLFSSSSKALVASPEYIIMLMLLEFALAISSFTVSSAVIVDLAAIAPCMECSHFAAMLDLISCWSRVKNAFIGGSVRLIGLRFLMLFDGFPGFGIQIVCCLGQVDGYMLCFSIVFQMRVMIGFVMLSPSNQPMIGIDHFGDAFIGFKDRIAMVTSMPVHGPVATRLGDVFWFCVMSNIVAWNSFCKYVVISVICISSVTHQIPVSVCSVKLVLCLRLPLRLFMHFQMAVWSPARPASAAFSTCSFVWSFKLRLMHFLLLYRWSYHAFHVSHAAVGLVGVFVLICWMA